MIKVVGKFYRKLFTSNDRLTEDLSMKTVIIDVPSVSKSETKKTLKLMSTDKAEGADGLLIDVTIILI